MTKMQRHLCLAALAGLGLRLVFVFRHPAVTGDTPIYEELAWNWLHHHVYGLVLGGQLTPVDVRVPGYPAFLCVIYALFGASRLAVMLAQAVLDLGTCSLTAALAARLVPEALSRRVAIAALWLAATCPFIANYAAVPLSEVLATFLTAAALLFFVGGNEDASFSPTAPRARGTPVPPWLLGGFCAGLGTLVRPETPLLLLAVALVLAVRWRRPADWMKLIRAGALMAAGLLLPLAPWAARNWHTLHRVQFLASRHAETGGEFVPRGFYVWTNTWLVRFRDVYLTAWKLEDEPISIEALPAAAFDSAEERARVAALLERYNDALSVSPEVDHEFAQIARERTARHPLRTYLWIPLGRMATLWFTPRIELLPYSGRLWPPGRRWEDDPVDFSVTLAFGLLNFLYVGLALAGAWRWRNRPAVALLAAFILVRTLYLTQVETPEPRYVVECFPAVLALAALAWVKLLARPAP